MTNTSTDPKPEAAAVRPAGPYAWYVLTLLSLTYVLNFIDRQILAILIEPIKQEFGVSDTAMGFLSGFAFVSSTPLPAFPLPAGPIAARANSSSPVP